jgi:SAM-dependent methyltransferase
MDYSLHDSLVLEVPSRVAQAAKVRRVLEHFSQTAGLTLAQSACVDIGCSSGVITRALSPHFRCMVGVDVDAHALAFALGPGEPHGSASFGAASGLALPFAAGAFDFALCSQVYQYVPDVPRLLAEVHRVLRSGGACYFSARNLWGIAAPENRMPLLASFSPRAALLISRGNTLWQHRAGTLWPYSRLRALARQLFAVYDYTTTVLTDPSLSELFVPVRYQAILSRCPAPLLAAVKPILPTHIWVLQKR